MANFLERLVAEWYEHQGFLIRTNVKFGPRAGGGHEGEIDVLAVNLKTKELIHVEASSDADSWDERRVRIERKFQTAQKYYAEILGFEFPSTKRIAIVGLKQARKPMALVGVEVLSFNDLMSKIKKYLRMFDPVHKAVPEGYGYLRAVQFGLWYGNDEQEVG